MTAGEILFERLCFNAAAALLVVAAEEDAQAAEMLELVAAVTIAHHTESTGESTVRCYGR